MKTNTAVKTDVRVREGSKTYMEFDKLTVLTLAGVSALVGVWAITSFVTAFATIGIAGLLKGFVIAVGLV